MLNTLATLGVLIYRPQKDVQRLIGCRLVKGGPEEIRTHYLYTLPADRESNALADLLADGRATYR